MVLAIILTGYLLVLIDVSILMVALPRIHHDLRFSPTSLSWAQNAYTLTFGGLLLLGARAGDLLGRRRTFTAGIALFAASSLAVALAQSPFAMIIARAIQGVGAAMLAPSTLALLSTSFPEGHQRTRAIAAYGALARSAQTAASRSSSRRPARAAQQSRNCSCWSTRLSCSRWLACAWMRRISSALGSWSSSSTTRLRIGCSSSYSSLPVSRGCSWRRGSAAGCRR